MPTTNRGYPYETAADEPGWSLTGGSDGDRQILAQVLDADVNTIANRVTATETVNTTQTTNIAGLTTRVTATETVNATQTTNIANLDTRVTTLEGQTSTPPVLTTITTSQTWTAPAGLVWAIVDVCAAGGAGGGAQNTGQSDAMSVGSGGGAGESVKLFLTADDIGASVVCTIGAGGTANAGAAGGAGGSTVFGAIATAAGGAGGQVLGSSSVSGTIPGGTGGFTPSASGQRTGGGHGAAGAQNAGSWVAGGTGGYSPFGSDGVGGATNDTGTVAVAGTDADGYGSGGGGAAARGTTPGAVGGGAGAPGVIFILAFVSG